MEAGSGRLIVEQVTGWSLVGIHATDRISRVPLFERVWFLDLTGNDVASIAALTLTVALTLQVVRSVMKKK